MPWSWPRRPSRLLRQQLLPSDRVHGIVTKGGEAAEHHPPRDQGGLHGPRRHGHPPRRAAGQGPRLLRGRRPGHRLRARDRAGHGLYGPALTTSSWPPSTSGTPSRWDGRSWSHLRRSPPTWATSATRCPPSIPSSAWSPNGAVPHQEAFADACATPSADQAVFDGALCHGPDRHRGRDRRVGPQPPAREGVALALAQHQHVLVDDVGHEGVGVAVGP